MTDGRRPVSLRKHDMEFPRWPDAVAARYRACGYWDGATIHEAFAASAERHAEAIALVDGTRRVTYRALAAAVDRLSRHLVQRDLCRGATIVFQLPNTVEFVIAYLAAVRVGAVPICALPHHRQAELGPIANLAQARAWFFKADFRNFDYASMARELAPTIPSLREIWTMGPRSDVATASFDELLATVPTVDDARVADVAPASSDIAVLQLSGGTTGIPKLIPRTHDDYVYNSRAFASATSLTRDDVLLVAIPIAHNFPLACPGVQGALLVGARSVMAPSTSAEVAFELIERERVTWMPAVPATLIQMTNHPSRARHDLSSLRRVYVGGQRLNAEAARAAIDAFGPVVRQVYGMAEGLLCCTRDDDPPDAHLHTQGRPMSAGDEIRAVDEDDQPVPPGDIGEMQCRGPYTIRGYFRAGDYNRTAFTADGFYRTGDMVRIDGAGFVTVEGRKKDLINRGGEKISAEEIENLLLAHPSVANVAVVAYADPVLGERCCACIVPRGDDKPSLEELCTFLREQKIATFKLPERLEYFARFPLTGVGKVSKRELRELVGQRPIEQSPSARRT